ncbi:3-hydroxyacyl-CoA dehydrogenase NAD-binding domain-containing protein [Verrucosispora sp. WMMC514]|uniref:3-hydroxyacyl-CoA dehydrogenase NAD-binding domain-containing protein n=1 Tax=Verrucosispora sp. WMMC514 TaxID=3015156 RepID=UPI00248B1918|nr:3-hydroxyacyl-CoA dehydrogenase NAD-binding domain-containing protein [Verrucosispora sp. WMMC514]WBB91149.1 3-hydroxyacyl-CoA dehydrogenase NAD-binding domain-containing protein [Verrucosispora sp. WMMC514]
MQDQTATALVVEYLNRAAAHHGEGHVTRDDVDTAMRLGCGLPQGPLAHLDDLGIDVAIAMLDDAGIRPAAILIRMACDGRLGRRVGRGFYDYDRPDIGQTGAPQDSGPSGAPRPPRRLGVVGSGTMARGIAQVGAVAGLHTTVVARTDERAALARAQIGRSLTAAVSRGRLDEPTRMTAEECLTTSADQAALAGCDVVVEAVAEDADIKRRVFAALAAACPTDTVLATTTSSLSVAACAAAAGRPADVLGLHFFNPAPAMRLVEIAATATTSAQTVATAHALVRRLGKVSVHSADRCGFIVNYLLFGYLNRAITLLERGAVRAEEFDATIRAEFGYPMGPFALLDTIGLDVSLAILRRLHDEFGEPCFAPAPALSALVAAGRLGRKTGTGFLSEIPRTRPRQTAMAGNAVATGGVR